MPNSALFQVIDRNVQVTIQSMDPYYYTDTLKTALLNITYKESNTANK